MALWVVVADYQLAGSSRDAAEFFAEARDEYPGDVYYLGHWGFQYYMDLDGTDSLIIERAANEQITSIKIDEGDTLIVPLISYPKFTPDPSGTTILDRKRYPIPCFMATLQGQSGAGFYSHFIGRLPYAIGAVSPEEYVAAELRVPDAEKSSEPAESN